MEDDYTYEDNGYGQWIDYNELYPQDEYLDEDGEWERTYIAFEPEPGLTVTMIERLKWAIMRLSHKVRYIGRRDPYDDIPF